MHTLTTKAQVQEQLRCGARIEPHPDRPTLLRLIGSNGVPIPAWQQALTACWKPH